MSRRSRLKSRTANIAYENLESRLALTTFLVTTTADVVDSTDGLISLREAITAADTNTAFNEAAAGEADGDIIRFDSSLNGGTITLSEGQFDITDDLLIQGGNSGIMIDGGANSRHFNVISTERVAFGKLTLQGGQADQGGSISSTGSGTLILFGMNFDSNEATGLGGGAVYHESGTLYVGGDSTFSNNSASGTSGSGGAILSASGLTAITGGSLTGNQANRAGGAVEVIDGSFYATNVSFGGTAEGDGNVAGPGGSAAPGNGGALHVTGSATVGINGGQIVGNFAAREGGGLWNQTGTDMYLNNGVLISNNVAAGAESHDGGGGIFNNGGNVYLKNATIVSNQATGAAGSGGGILSTSGKVLLIDSLLDANSSARAGGGVEVVDGFVGFTNSVVSNNDTGITIAAAPGNGGGLHVSGAASVVVTGTAFTGNAAAREGGGLWNQVGSNMFINGSSTISENTAAGNAADDGGGGIFNNGGNVYVRGSMISGNLADGDSGSGGGVFSTAGRVLIIDSSINLNHAARAGGGVEIIDGVMRLQNSTLNDNSAGISITAAPGNGGGLHVTGNEATVVLVNSTVSGNVAANQGGGLWNQTDSLMFIHSGSRITGNTATGDGAVGGGVYNKGYLQSVDSFFEQNGAAFQGGGVFFTPTGQGRISSNGINGNTAGNQGGGVFNGGSIFIEDTNFSANVTSINGGAVFTDTMATSTLDNNTFSGNLPNNAN